MPATLLNGQEKDLFTGVVLKGVGGFYEVYSEGKKITLTCKLRGKMRLAEGGVIAGDQVEVSITEPGLGMIEKVRPRKNRLLRPKVANLDQALLVLAARDPAPDWLLLDKMIVTALYNRIAPLICFNKCDLLEGAMLEEVTALLAAYAKAGFPVVFTSSREKSGIAEIYELLKGHISVLAGPSGVGKSSLLNALFPSLSLTEGEISSRLRRGKHTTRHVEIWPLEHDVLVADTPGFSLFDLPGDLKPQNLSLYYPEFSQTLTCRFDGCIHDKEPDCTVKAAVLSGGIDEGRYNRYIKLFHELRDREEDYR